PPFRSRGWRRRSGASGRTRDGEPGAGPAPGEGDAPAVGPGADASGTRCAPEPGGGASAGAHGGAPRRPAPHVPWHLRVRPPRRCGRVRRRTRGATGPEAVPVTAAPAVGPGPLRRIGAAARRVDAATPPERERAVDGLRAVAICGVVLGHWLVSAT